MKKLLILALLAPIMAGAQKAEKFQVKGSVENLPDSLKPDWVYLMYRHDGENITDSLQTSNGKYAFSGKIAEPTMARLRVKYAANANGAAMKSVPWRDMAIVYIEKGKQEVRSRDSFSNVTVKGSTAHKQFDAFTKLEKTYDPELEPLYTSYSELMKANKKDEAEKKMEEINALTIKKNEAVYGSFLQSNKSSGMSIYALQKYVNYELDPEKHGPIFDGLSAKVKKTPSGVQFGESLEIARKTAIGQMAMEFSQNDTLDQPVALSSFRGKYVLVDFWASWCGPCRRENPNVVALFNKFKNQNFTVLGVSLDRTGQKDRWLKAIHDDGLAWTQVSDLKFWDNEVAKMYGIRFIPQNLLIDPTGRIVAKNLNGEKLQQKVTELIEGKKAF